MEGEGGHLENPREVVKKGLPGSVLSEQRSGGGEGAESCSCLKDKHLGRGNCKCEDLETAQVSGI